LLINVKLLLLTPLAACLLFLAQSPPSNGAGGWAAGSIHVLRSLHRGIGAKYGKRAGEGVKIPDFDRTYFTDVPYS